MSRVCMQLFGEKNISFYYCKRVNMHCAYRNKHTLCQHQALTNHLIQTNRFATCATLYSIPNYQWICQFISFSFSLTTIEKRTKNAFCVFQFILMKTLLYMRASLPCYNFSLLLRKVQPVSANFLCPTTRSTHWARSGSLSLYGSIHLPHTVLPCIFQPASHPPHHHQHLHITN